MKKFKQELGDRAEANRIYHQRNKIKWLEKQIDEKNKEIKRLNKKYENAVADYEEQRYIINELEKYLIEEIEDYDKHINLQYITDIAREQYEGEKICFEDMLGKLQELKESDKE